MVYTVGQAAKATGKHKTTISKAIKKGVISATPKPDGSYEIDPAELHRVYPPMSKEETGQPSNGLSQSTEFLLRINRLEMELQAAAKERALIDSQINDLKADKEFLQNELKKSTLLLTAPQEQTQSPPASFWQRLFGGKTA